MIRVLEYYRRGELQGFIIEKNGSGLYITLDEAEEFLRQLEDAMKQLEGVMKA